jgi:hypothetical protein
MSILRLLFSLFDTALSITALSIISKPEIIFSTANSEKYDLLASGRLTNTDILSSL